MPVQELMRIDICDCTFFQAIESQPWFLEGVPRGRLLGSISHSVRMSTKEAPALLFGSAGIYWDTIVSSLLYPVLSDKDLWAAWKHKAKGRLHLKFPSWNMWDIKVHLEGREHLERRHHDLAAWKRAATGRKLTNERHGFHILLKSNRTFPLCWMP